MNNFQPIQLYFVTQALPGSKFFYERKEELSEVITFLNAGHSISITGERRAGKTTFLKYVSIEILQNDFIPVFVDAQFTGTEQEFLTELIEQAYKEMLKYFTLIPDISLHLPKLDEDNPSKARHLFREDLEMLRQILEVSPYQVIWLIDEIEILRSFENSILFQFLRPIAEWDSHFRMIVASYDALYILSIKGDWSPFFNAFQPIELRGLSPDVSKQLIDDGLAQMGIQFAPNFDVDCMLVWTGQKPFYLKWSLHSIGKAINHERSSLNLTESIWESSKLNFLHENTIDAHFKNLWGEGQEAHHVTDRQRIILSFLATQTEPFTLKKTLEGMQDQKIVTWDNPMEDLIQDLKRLEQLGFLTNDRGYYRFTSGCLQDWIAENKPL